MAPTARLLSVTVASLVFGIGSLTFVSGEPATAPATNAAAAAQLDPSDAAALRAAYSRPPSEWPAADWDPNVGPGPTPRTYTLGFNLTL